MDTLRNLRAEVKLLVTRGLVEPVPGLEDLSEDTLRAVISEYKESKLKSVNKTICVALLDGLTSLCKRSETLSDVDVDSMRDDLLGDEGFMSVATDTVGKVTPCIPYVGVAVGACVLGRYLYAGVVAARDSTETE